MWIILDRKSRTFIDSHGNCNRLESCCILLERNRFLTNLIGMTQLPNLKLFIFPCCWPLLYTSLATLKEELIAFLKKKSNFSFILFHVVSHFLCLSSTHTLFNFITLHMLNVLILLILHSLLTSNIYSKFKYDPEERNILFFNKSP